MKIIGKLLLGSLLSILTITVASAQPPTDNGENCVSILFRFDSDVVDASFMDNGQSLEALGVMLSDSELMSRLESVEIVATSSPDGNPAYNRTLAQRRAESLKQHIICMCADIDPAIISARAGDSYWDGLIEAVEGDDNVPARSELLEVLGNPDLSDWDKNRRMNALSGGRTFAYLRDNYILRRLRSGSTEIAFIVRQEPQPKPEPVPEPQPEPAPEPEPVVEVIHEPQPEPKKRLRFDVRTNLLYDAFMLPTLGVEIPVGDLGIKLDGSYAYWGKAEGKVQKMWLVNPELRWYVSENNNRFYTGVSANFAKYNVYDGILFRDNGYQGTAWSAGLVAGYKLRLSSNFALDFNVGLGYSQFDYDAFTVIDEVRTSERRNVSGNFLGPTQAGINLIWTIQ